LIPRDAKEYLTARSALECGSLLPLSLRLSAMLEKAAASRRTPKRFAHTSVIWTVAEALAEGACPVRFL